MRGVYMTSSSVKFIPALLASTVSRGQSLALKEACMRVMAFIVETVPEEALLPPCFINDLSKMMRDNIFSLAVIRSGLSILVSFYERCGEKGAQAMEEAERKEVLAYLNAEDTISCLQYIYYATQSQECRAKVYTLLTGMNAPLQVAADLPLRSDVLEDIMFAGMIQQLELKGHDEQLDEKALAAQAAKERAVLLETLDVCRGAMTLSQPRFLHAFEAKKGLSKLLTILRRYTDDEEVMHLTLELLRAVVETKMPSETEAIPITSAVFRVLQHHQQCRTCVKYLTYLIRRLSVFRACRG